MSNSQNIPPKKRPGRKPILRSSEEAQKRGDAYFEQCGRDKTPVTITGLSRALGFNNRRSLLYYQAKPEFAYVVSRLRLRVEMAYEERLFGPNAGGAIFALKNMGWTD